MADWKNAAPTFRAEPILTTSTSGGGPAGRNSWNAWTSLIPWQRLEERVRPRTGQRDPEMHQVKKGNQYHFGMKLYFGVERGCGARRHLPTYDPRPTGCCGDAVGAHRPGELCYNLSDPMPWKICCTKRSPHNSHLSSESLVNRFASGISLNVEHIIRVRLWVCPSNTGRALSEYLGTALCWAAAGRSQFPMRAGCRRYCTFATCWRGTTWGRDCLRKSSPYGDLRINC